MSSCKALGCFTHYKQFYHSWADTTEKHSSSHLDLPHHDLSSTGTSGKDFTRLITLKSIWRDQKDAVTALQVCKENLCHLPCVSPGMYLTENTHIYIGLISSVEVQDLQFLPTGHRISLTSGMYSKRSLWGRKSILPVNKASAKIRRASLRKDFQSL